METGKSLRLIKNDDLFVLQDGERGVETYSFDKNINFSGLIKYLTDYGFESKIVFETQDDLSESEKKLADLIRKIIDEYNNRVDKYQEFLKTQEK